VVLCQMSSSRQWKWGPSIMELPTRGERVIPGGKGGGGTFGFEAGEFQQAVEDGPGPHGVADQDDGAVSVPSRRQDVSQQAPSPSSTMQGHRPGRVNQLQAWRRMLILSHCLQLHIAAMLWRCRGHPLLRPCAPLLSSSKTSLEHLQSLC